MQRKRIVVMGFMASIPIAGVIWQHIHYIVGLQRLGHEVYYIEDSQRFPYNPTTWETLPDYSFAVKTLGELAREHGFEERWGFCARYLDPVECTGLSHARILELYREADVILNVCGSQELYPALLESSRLIYVESDPGLEQMAVDNGDEKSIAKLNAHHSLFTFGETSVHRITPSRRMAIGGNRRANLWSPICGSATPYRLRTHASPASRTGIPAD